MSNTQQRRRSQRRGTPPRRDLRIAWVNVGRRPGAHEAALSLLWQEDIDVIQIQEPAWWAESRTKNHPGYDRFDPVDSWNDLADRPRVMTYVKKDKKLKATPRQPVSRDLLWVQVNGIDLLNFYRQPETREVLDYLCRLEAPARCVAGGDANAHDPTWEPGLLHAAHGGRRLANWSKDSGMNFTGEPGVPTHELGHVIDLVFSNIPFTQTLVNHDLRTGSDHATLITVIPGRGDTPPPRPTYKVPDSRIPLFSQALTCALTTLPDPGRIPASDTALIDEWVALFSTAWGDAFMTAASRNHRRGRDAPWWTDECHTAWRQWKDSEPFLRPDQTGDRRTPSPSPSLSPSPESDSKAHFLRTVRKAKRLYWVDILNNASSDADIYKVVAWHKLSSSRRAPPINTGSRVLYDPGEKARHIASTLLERFSAQDDLPDDPLAGWVPEEASELLFCQAPISEEEAEARTIGVKSTSPGIDRTSVKLMKAVWPLIGPLVTKLFNKCLEASYYPRPWRVSDVALIPKIGKGDYSDAKSYRPIALISCLGKGLERVMTKRMTKGALATKIISPQHISALHRRSAPDLATALTHDMEWALAKGHVATLATMDVQGAFDALLARRLLARMRAQGWHITVLRMVESFLSDRTIRARLDGAYTEQLPVPCGTPQGSPWSAILYMLYLAELLQMEPKLRFGYADDVALVRTTPGSLDENAEAIAEDVRGVLAYGEANKIYFATAKTELIHFSRRKNTDNPPVRIDDSYIIRPAEAPAQREGTPPKQTAVRWLGVWFDRRLTFKRHIQERCARAEKVARHLRNLANTKNGPPAHALRKAVTTVVIPTALYAAETWYAGRKIPARNRAQRARGATVSARVGWHVETVQRAINTAARAALPVWRTTPNRTLCRDAGIPSADIALEEARLRFAFRLRTLDRDHLLVARMEAPILRTGRGAGTRSRIRTRLQTAAQEFPTFDRPVLTPQRFTPGSRADPTEGRSKEAATKDFERWWALLQPNDMVVFSDGSEMEKKLAYGYAIYRPGDGEGDLLDTGRASLDPCSVVFDAEALGALRGLQHAIRLANLDTRIWVCLDNTAAIWCLRGTASLTSQKHFIAFHKAADSHPGSVRIKWCPGHMDIFGNEFADRMAKLGLKAPPDPGSTPTLSGVKMGLRKQLAAFRIDHWNKTKQGLSQRYLAWDLDYDLNCPMELEILSRPLLHRLLALRTGHGDFSAYHRKFNHPEDSCEMACRHCGADKTPEHIVFCRHSLAQFTKWPWPEEKDRARPYSSDEKRAYLRWIVGNPEAFRDFVRVTGCFQAV